MSKDHTFDELSKPAIAQIYTGEDLFKNEVLEEDSKEQPGQISDPIERIIRPQAKAYGEEDGRHRRK